MNNCLFFHQACTSSSSHTWYIWCQFHLSIPPKALTKERSIHVPSSKYCTYLVCGLHIKPKFKASLPSVYRFTSLQFTVQINLAVVVFLLCGFAELVEHNTPDPLPNNNLKQYNWQQVCNSELLKWLDLINIKNRSALKVLEEEFQQCTARIVSKNHETSLYIVTQTFTVDLDFDCCKVGSLKRSSCAVEHMSARLNWLLN